jgi:hypothetical protein
MSTPPRRLDWSPRGILNAVVERALSCARGGGGGVGELACIEFSTLEVRGGLGGLGGLGWMTSRGSPVLPLDRNGSSKRCRLRAEVGGDANDLFRAVG